MQKVSSISWFVRLNKDAVKRSAAFRAFFRLAPLKSLSMKFIPLLLLCFPLNIVLGQNMPEKYIISPVQIDTSFIDTLTFTSKWDYPWYIAVDDNGHFETALGYSIGKDDTVRLYHTANCVTNHQGEHHIRYCDARIHNDTIQLVFMPELPAYASSLTVFIHKNNFRSDFQAVYPSYIPGEKLTWRTTKQKLILNNSGYKLDDLIMGYIEVEFIETAAIPRKKPVSNNYYFRGFFKTRLDENE